MSRCRICSANDRDQLVDDVARAMWNTQASSNPDDEWREWDLAPLYWRNRMREFAEVTLNAISLGE